MSSVPHRSSTSRAVVYITDAGFLIPSLVSAEQVLRQVAGTADVLIALAGMSDAEMDRIEPVIADLHLRAIRMDDIALPKDVSWLLPHVTATSLGRFYLPRYLPSRYRSIVYIDGDTQVVGDIVPLVELDVPSGLVAAAPDCAWVTAARWRFEGSYLERLGVSDPAQYVNTGVLAFARDTLDRVMPEALGYFLANSEACRFVDQSALNAVMRGKLFPLSPRYNFLTDYHEWAVQRLFDPVILHFAGHLKPWKVAGWPLGDRYFGTYADMLRRYPVLAPYASEVKPYVAPPPKGGSVLKRASYSPLLHPLRLAWERHRIGNDRRRLPGEFALP
jgi:lipopolysaccharide biosynthesis glycosyltransferase